MNEDFIYVNVLLSNAKLEDNIFTYKVKKDEYSFIKVGMRVIVPFGFSNRFCEGYIIEVNPIVTFDETKIKNIKSIPDRFVYFDEEMLELAKFIKDKYLTTLSEAINTFVPQSVRNIKEKEEKTNFIQFTNSFSIMSREERLIEIEKLKSGAKKRNQGLILEYIEEKQKQNERIKEDDVLEKFNVTKSTIDTLRKNNYIEKYSDYLISDFESQINKEKIENKDKNKNLSEDNQKLTDAQNDIYEKIINSKSDRFLLKGITGSGKTEIFIKLTDKVTKEGKNVIILVPEIGLTPQMVKRFEENFENISIMHSKLSATEKLNEWKKVKEHKVNVIIGPRSAIFMPISNIGLIIIDEEHEMTYKSEQTPKYKTHEVLEKRAEYNNAKVIYSSATPSLETYKKALDNEIELLELNERYNNKPLPIIEAVDMREELEKGNRSIFSNKLALKIKEKLDKKEQVLLFLNRRGYSTFVSCRKCGYVMKCDHCSVPYVYHQKDDTLECHYCFSKIKNVHLCPNCGSKYIRHFGIGTEKVEEEIKRLFPSARVLRMDKDTTAKKDSQEEMFDAFKRGDYDILVGTQMIAKGHNFPNCTLVGIVTADTMLNFQDFRALERTFQLIEQVAGRAGRLDKEGEVILQTYEPENYAIENAIKYNYEGFMKKEMGIRKLMKCPPYSYLLYITFNGENEEEVKSEINKLAEIIKTNNEVINNSIEILGPGASTMSKQNDKYRYQLIIRGLDDDLIRKIALFTINEYKASSKNQKNMLIQLNFD